MMFLNLNLSLSILLLFSSPTLGKYHSHSQGIDQSSQIIFENTNGTFDSIRHILKKSSIIPEVLGDFTPTCFLAPYYAKKHRSVKLGNELKPPKVQSPPTLKIYCPHHGDIGGEKMKGLTVVLTDPDAPSRENPEWGQVCHWIARVPVEQKKDALEGELKLSIARGGVNDVVEYKPPGPPPKTGFHRYVFVLLVGENLNLTAPEERKNWGTGKEGYGVRDWAREEGLEVVGANYFISKHKKQK